MREGLSIALVSAMVGVAHAQSGHANENAIQLAYEARKVHQQERREEACRKFEARLLLDPTIDRRFELAACYERIGKLASAWNLYREVIGIVKNRNDIVRGNCARTNANRLEALVPKLTVSIPARPPDGFVVARDGERVAPGALGVAIYLDPGEYEITASAPEFEPFKKTIVLEKGDTKTVTVPDLERRKRPPPYRRYIAIGALSAGGTAIGVGLLFGWRATSRLGEARTLCGESLICSTDDYARGNRLIHDANASATAATALVIGGSAAVLTGAVLLLVTPGPGKGQVARITPWAHDHGAGLSIEGRF